MPIHRGDGHPKIPCEVRAVDDLTADAMSLAENFAREGMHPLDEAESFAKLAREDAKGVSVAQLDQLCEQSASELQGRSVEGGYRS
ncbi:MAG: hypothetical protein NTU53_15645 [Planctomycetota bacterium]|nr:hypothetical protein [Planctomycetota bacterium]